MMIFVGIVCMLILLSIAFGLLAFPGVGWFIFLVVGMVGGFVIGD